MAKLWADCVVAFLRSVFGILNNLLRGDDEDVWGVSSTVTLRATSIAAARWKLSSSGVITAFVGCCGDEFWVFLVLTFFNIAIYALPAT